MTVLTASSACASCFPDSLLRLQVELPPELSRGGDTRVSVAKLLPPNLCPLAFHNVFPYYVTLSHNGWFVWVEKGGGVIVQCPSPCHGVEMKIFRQDAQRSIRVEVINARSACPFGHCKGQSFEIPFPSASGSVHFVPAALMPYLLLLAHTTDDGRNWSRAALQCSDGQRIHHVSVLPPGTPPPDAPAAPSLFYTQEAYSIETRVMKKVCKYHKRRWQTFAPQDVVRNFDPDAFYAAYPYCLALLYRATPPNGTDFIACHPAAGSAALTIRRKARRNIVLHALKKCFEWCMSKTVFGRPDWEDFDIVVTVSTAGNTPQPELAPGREYTFNTAIGRLDELCPASFHGLYLVTIPFIKGYPPPWQPPAEAGSTSTLFVHCPDHEGMIYNISRGQLPTAHQ